MPKAESRLEILQVCKLLQCVRAKDKHQVEKLTTNGVPHLINYNDADEGNTALSIAALTNDEDMIEFLLELGAHPDVMDLSGRTAAMRAAEYGHVNCVEKLLTAGADMTLVDQEGKGIIFYCIASTQRHLKCLELVLEGGADVNNKAKDSTPVFLLACETSAENEEMCLNLLDHGADPNSHMERGGRTALMAACASGSVKVVKAIILKGGDVNALDVRKNHAAHFAAGGGHLECLMCMGGYGAQFEQTNVDSDTPIHNAAKAGFAMCCKYLSQRGCNPKPKNGDGNTARAIAKEEGFKDVSKELRKAEKQFGKVGKNNDPWMLTLYDWLMQRQEEIIKTFKELDQDQVGTVGKAEFCETLMSMKAPVEEEELQKLAALHDKNRENRLDYNEFLAAKKWINKNYLVTAFEGKKKKKKGKKGGKKKGKFKLVMPICMQEEGHRTIGGGPPEMYIPYHINYTDTGRFDRDHPPQHPLQDDSAWYLQNPERAYININDAARMGDFESLKAALKKGVSIDTRDRYYKTPLMTSSGVGHLDMVKFLVENGASVNLRDNFKWTALHHACHAGQLDVVQYLVEHGGEIDAATMNGGTPLTRAIESSRENVVQYLIDHGVKMLTENKKGMTPMDIAEAWADPRVLNIVQTKWESMPHPDKKTAGKKGAKGKGSPKGKRPVSAPKEKETDAVVRPVMYDDTAALDRKGSILRAASALAGGLDEREDITYTPLRAWTQQPTSKDLIHDKEVRRERFGWEVDFPDFQMPFQKNVAEKLTEMDNE
ncbi:ankyrin repeat and EF-hand domain-containing protein 1-like isoform X2 [Babylonia areolata]|uniref:ankyrin repeat and EF-hand domain-containing protein 1-like isoform X2 n=1 Tax=Babylonia areolata TaxID=304850 RepID=UPI003FD293A4